MSRQIQFRRGTTMEHETFTGAIGEVTVDTTTKTLRVHDGETVGGTALARADSVTDMTGTDYVTEWQYPAPENNYTWYRKYRSGWVEQGGRYISDETMIRRMTLPICMANTDYNLWGCVFGEINDRVITMNIVSATTISAAIHNTSAGAAKGNFTWFVSGMAA